MGRTRAGKVADGVGFDVYDLRTTRALWQGTGASITRKARGYKFANTQHTQTMEERDPFRAATYTEFHNRSRVRPSRRSVFPDDLTLFPQWEYKQHKWGMSIDLNCVHRMPGLHHRLPVGKQYPGSRARKRSPRAVT